MLTLYCEIGPCCLCPENQAKQRNCNLKQLYFLIIVISSDSSRVRVFKNLEMLIWRLNYVYSTIFHLFGSFAHPSYPKIKVVAQFSWGNRMTLVMRSTWDPMVGMDLGEGCGGYATPLPQSFLSGAPSPKKNQGYALAWWNIYLSQNVVTVYWRLCDLHNEVKPDIDTVTQMSGIRYVPLK